MDALAFGWLSSGRQQALLTWVRELLSHWLSEWSVKPLELELEADNKAPSAAWQWAYRQHNHWLAIRFEHGSLQRLGAALADVDDSGESLLSRELGAMALESLAAALLAERASSLPALKALAEPSLQARMGAALLRLRLGGLSLQIGLNGSLTRMLAPPCSSQSARPALHPRALALSEATVQLDMRLNLSGCELADFVNLQPGDVIVSSSSLHDSFRLHCGQRELPVAARLAARGASKVGLIESAAAPDHKPGKPPTLAPISASPT